jgi:diguanylate cyclase
MKMAGENLFLGFVRLEWDHNVVGPPLSHDQGLVGLSLLTALIAAYAALELAERGKTHFGARAQAWRAAAGMLMGMSIWTAHFIGILAIQSPLLRGFEVAETAFSGLFALAWGAVAFSVVGRQPTTLRYIGAGAVTAGAALVMHYWGVFALRIDAELSFRPVWALLTAAGAFSGAIGTLFLAYRLSSTPQRVIAAFPVAAIIACMHYVDMASMVLSPQPSFLAPDAGPPEILVAGAVVLITAIAAAASVRVALTDRRRSASPGPAPGENEGVVIIPGIRARRTSRAPARSRDVGLRS